MRTLLTELERLAKEQDVDGYLRVRWEFHAACYEAAGRPRLVAEVERLFWRAERYNRIVLSSRERFRRSVAHYRRLLRGMQDRRPARRRAGDPRLDAMGGRHDRGAAAGETAEHACGARVGRRGPRVRAARLRAGVAGCRVLGPAFTAQGAPGDNLALHRAVAEAAVGRRDRARGRRRARARALRRHRRDGCASTRRCGAHPRRCDPRPGELEAIGFPVFHLGASPLKPAKDGPAELRVPVEIGGVLIEPGDLVAADADGI